MQVDFIEIGLGFNEQSEVEAGLTLYSTAYESLWIGCKGSC